MIEKFLSSFETKDRSSITCQVQILLFFDALAHLFYDERFYMMSVPNSDVKFMLMWAIYIYQLSFCEFAMEIDKHWQRLEMPG